eukprot:jgi/Tetstr1/438391/TSEL_026957.t1
MVGPALGPWAEYEADPDADDVLICPPTRFLLPPLEVREVWKARRSANSLVEDIAATISQRINTPLELLHAPRLIDTMMLVGVYMHQYHTEPKLLRVGDDNLCAISLGKEDEEFADTLRLAVALTSLVAILQALRLRIIVIYLAESEFDPSELLMHSHAVREAGELGGNTGHSQLRHTTMGMPPTANVITGARADDEDELELNHEESDNTMDVDTAHRGAAGLAYHVWLTFSATLAPALSSAAHIPRGHN